jgi:hypothetical protein
MQDSVLLGDPAEDYIRWKNTLRKLHCSMVYRDYTIYGGLDLLAAKIYIINRCHSSKDYHSYKRKFDLSPTSPIPKLSEIQSSLGNWVLLMSITDRNPIKESLR